MSSAGLVCRKAMGRLSNLAQLMRETPVPACLGIGHTRWATHGEPSTVNAHPHLSGNGRVAVVHNGIIENYLALKMRLIEQSHNFASETDTEVIAHLLEETLKNSGSTTQALLETLGQLEGAYALCVIYADEPDRIYAARKGSPLVIGIRQDVRMLASDIPAIQPYIDQSLIMEDGELAVLQENSVELINLLGEKVHRDSQPVTKRVDIIECAGFETFMLKEIHEQPRVLRSLITKHITDHQIDIQDLSLKPDYFRKLNRVMIVACGTAYHAGMFGKLILENKTNLAVETDVASEFRYRDPRIDPGTLVIPVSQSGETADTLASVRMAREWGCRVLAICNVEGSTLTRECDDVFYTCCGPEIGVASTKAYSAQLMAFLLLALHIAKARGAMNAEAETGLINALKTVPDAIHYVLERKEAIRVIAEKHQDGPSSLYLGRKYNYPTALEGALKNKEISYQHAEGYAAGEMKHGPIALINKYLPVVCICTRTRDEVYRKMLSNTQEVAARHGRIIALATDGDREVAPLAEDIIFVPDVKDECSPLVNVVALQLLAYYAAQARGTDIDKPRNLAKSVTVE